MTDRRPIIMTARMDPVAHAWLDGLRRSYFPAERNLLAAHLTLFHHLPPGQLDQIQAHLENVAHDHGLIEGTVASLRSLGNGVAFTIDAPPLVALRKDMASRWAEWLIPQDKQGFRQHVTIQNKVPADKARDTLAILQKGFSPRPIRIEALQLWHYDGGPWSWIAEAAFGQP